MNTAEPRPLDRADQSGHRYGPARVGAGRVDASYAVNTVILAYAIASRVW